MKSLAFAAPNALVPLRSRLALRRPRVSPVTASLVHGVSLSRRDVLQHTAITALSVLASGATAGSVLAAESPGRNLRVQADGLETAAMCMHLLGPVERYVREGAWDNARTNVNYCTRVLAVRKKMQNAAEDMTSDDSFLTAMEATAEVVQLLTVLDSSVYTAIFIPSEEGVSFEQRGYQKAAFNALDEARDYLQRFIGLYPEQDVEKAIVKAKKAKYEIVVDR